MPALRARSFALWAACLSLLAALAGCAAPTAKVAIDLRQADLAGKSNPFFLDADELPEGLELVTDDEEGDGFLDEYAMHTNPGLADEDRFHESGVTPEKAAGAMYWGTKDLQHRLEIWVLGFPNLRQAERYIQGGEHCVPDAARTLLLGQFVVQVELDHRAWGTPADLLRNAGGDYGYRYPYVDGPYFPEEHFAIHGPDAIAIPFPPPPMPVPRYELLTWETVSDESRYVPEEPTVPANLTPPIKENHDAPAETSEPTPAEKQGQRLLPDWVEPVADRLVARTGAEDVCQRPEFRPDGNDSPAEAQPIGAEWLEASLSRRDDRDYYTFDVEALAHVEVHLASRDWTPGIELTRRDGAWQELFWADAYGEDFPVPENWARSVHYALLEPGSYRLMVNSYDPVREYALRVQVEDPSMHWLDSDNDWTQATWIGPGVSGPTDLDPRGDEDWYAFKVDRRSDVEVRVLSRDQMARESQRERGDAATVEPWTQPWDSYYDCCYGDAELWLYDAAHNEIAYSDDTDDGSLSAVLLELDPGEYYAKVRGYDGQVLHGYLVEVAIG